MKVLVVNNNTVHMKNLLGALKGHDVEVQDYRPGIDFHTEGKDVIILSGGGGEGLEVNDDYKPGYLWYQDEMNLIRTATKPVVGICMGFEVMVRAFGGKVTEIGQLVQGFKKVEVLDSAYPLVGAKSLEQFESHSWRVKDQDVPKQFQKLAKSETGIEIIKYKNLLGVQFHPEKGGSLSLQRLTTSIIN